jgi:hypothetical protein
MERSFAGPMPVLRLNAVMGTVTDLVNNAIDALVLKNVTITSDAFQLLFAAITCDSTALKSLELERVAIKRSDLSPSPWMLVVNALDRAPNISSIIIRDCGNFWRYFRGVVNSQFIGLDRDEDDQLMRRVKKATSLGFLMLTEAGLGASEDTDQGILTLLRSREVNALVAPVTSGFGKQLADVLANNHTLCTFRNTNTHGFRDHDPDWRRVQSFIDRNWRMQWGVICNQILEIVIILLPLRVPLWELLAIIDWVLLFEARGWLAPQSSDGIVQLRLENGTDPNAKLKLRLVDSVLAGYTRVIADRK